MSTPILQASVVRCPTCDGSGVVPHHKQDEIDRLRALKEAETKALIYMKGERDCLRAENAELKAMIRGIGQRIYDTKMFIRRTTADANAILAKKDEGDK